MIDKPQDLVLMLGIAAFVIVLVGIGLTDIQTEGVNANTTFFSNVQGELTNSEGLQGARDDSAAALEGDSSSSTQDTSENLIVKGSRALLKLGKSFNAVNNAVEDSQKELGFPAEYVTILGIMLLVSFAVVIYTFWRNGQ